jgi:hypothetical protein
MPSTRLDNRRCQIDRDLGTVAIGAQRHGAKRARVG